MNTIQAYRTMRRIKEVEADFLEFFKTRHGSTFTRCYCTPTLYTKLIGNLPQNSIHPIYNMQIVWLDSQQCRWEDYQRKKNLCLLLIGANAQTTDNIPLNKGLAFLSIAPGQCFLDPSGHLMNPDDFEKFKAVLVRLDFEELDHE